MSVNPPPPPATSPVPLAGFGLFRDPFAAVGSDPLTLEESGLVVTGLVEEGGLVLALFDVGPWMLPGLGLVELAGLIEPWLLPLAVEEGGPPGRSGFQVSSLPAPPVESVAPMHSCSRSQASKSCPACSRSDQDG